MKRFLLIMCTAILSSTCAPDSIFAVDPGTVYLSRWPEGKKAAISLRFDDTLESHLTIVVPLLDSAGIVGTFMVNPGKEFFRSSRKIWMEDLPSKGHRLGNHTMNHRGARTLSEAEYEIGEADRILRSGTKNKKSLMVFASGGGERWGGKNWSDADNEYKQLPEKFGLVDLYDGTHPYVSGRSDQTASTLFAHVARALKEGDHQAYVFHQVGRSRPRDVIRKLLTGRANVVSESVFRTFIDKLKDRREDLWIAPLIDVIKYEHQVSSSLISGVKVVDNRVFFRLKITTDPALYDLPLTCFLKSTPAPVYVLQNGRQVKHRVDERGLLLTLQPKSSEIEVIFPRNLT